MINPFEWFLCVSGIKDRHAYLDGYCFHCGKREPNGNRQATAYPGSQAGTLPVPAPGKRAGGAQPAASAGAGTCACGGRFIPLGSTGSTLVCVSCLRIRHPYNLDDEGTPTPVPTPVTEEILAWRGWRLLNDLDGEFFLWSVNHECAWTGPTLVADVQPTKYGASGIYALMSRTEVIQQGYAPNVVGQVALSGIVVEGEHGYRAERATIRSLTIFGYPAPTVRPIDLIVELGERYQCEVYWEEGQPEESRNTLMNVRFPVPGVLSASTQLQGLTPTAQGQIYSGFSQSQLQGYFPGKLFGFSP